MKRTLCTTSPEFNSSYYIVSTTEIRGSTDNTFTWIRCETTTIIISLGCAIYTDLGTWWASSHGKEHHPRWGLFFHSLGLHFGGLPTSPSLSRFLCLFVVAHEAQHSTAPVAGYKVLGFVCKGVHVSLCYVVALCNINWWCCCCCYSSRGRSWKEDSHTEQSYIFINACSAISYFYTVRACNYHFAHTISSAGEVLFSGVVVQHQHPPA